MEKIVGFYSESERFILQRQPYGKRKLALADAVLRDIILTPLDVTFKVPTGIIDMGGMIYKGFMITKHGAYRFNTGGLGCPGAWSLSDMANYCKQWDRDSDSKRHYAPIEADIVAANWRANPLFPYRIIEKQWLDSLTLRAPPARPARPPILARPERVRDPAPKLSPEEAEKLLADLLGES